MYKLLGHHIFSGMLALVLLAFLNTAASAHAENRQSFGDWLSDFKFEARMHGIDQDVIDDAFADVTAPDDSVIELDHKQPEGTKTFSEYMEVALSEKKIATARDEYRQHRTILKKIEKRYGVPASIIVALWGTESNFGKTQGSFSVIESLATLAYDGRRSQFFRSELMNALQIMQDEGISYEEMTGSWAGAMGQTQFMPSSFLKFAVDFNHDGVRDIWNTDADALASIANYLKTKGWSRKTGWGLAVSLPDGANTEELRKNKGFRTLKEWNKLGFRRENGRILPRTNTMARLVIPDDESSFFLVFPNYDVIMDWNHSIYFATSIGLLADKIGKR